GLVSRVAAEAFDLDPARLTVPPLDGLDLPQLRVPMLAVGAELTAGAGGPLAAESLANLLAVHLIRHVSAPRPPARRRAGTLPPPSEAPRRRGVRGGPPRRSPAPGAAARGRPPQPQLLRLAVQAGHRAAAAPVRHPAPCRAGQAAPANRDRTVPGGGRRARRV